LGSTKKRWTWLIGLAALACGVATLVVAGRHAFHRWERDRAIARCHDGSESLGDLWVLQHTDDVESVLALADDVEQRHSPEDLRTMYRRTALRITVELHAHAHEQDPRVGDRFRAWTSSPDVDLAFLGHYLIEELRSPRYPTIEVARAHEGYEGGGSYSGSFTPLTENVAVLRCWGMTVENAGRLEGRVPTLDLRDSQEPRKAVRAWAALNGCTVREKPGNILEILPGQR
jgi:hypothetical protein